ncbi:toxin-antitoxin system, antitoxin component, Xre domain protein, partial [Ancylostoma duodenale]
PQLDAEAREWAARFVHLRVLGVKCGVPSAKPQDSTIPSSTRNAPLASPQENGQAVTRPAISRPNRVATMRKSSKSAAQPRPAGDHLPKLSNVKTK